MASAPLSGASTDRRQSLDVGDMHGNGPPVGGSRRGRRRAAEMAMVGVRYHGVVERKHHKFVGCNTVGIAVLRLYL